MRLCSTLTFSANIYDTLQGHNPTCFFSVNKQTYLVQMRKKDADEEETQETKEECERKITLRRTRQKRRVGKLGETEEEIKSLRLSTTNVPIIIDYWTSILTAAYCGRIH